MDKQQQDAIAAAAKEYKEYQHLADEAKQEAEAARARLLALLPGPGVIFAGVFKIALQTVKQSRIDGAKLKAEYPQVAELVTVSSSYDRLTVN